MLKIDNLSILYKSTGQLAVKDVSFSVKKGEVLALLGPSGCGKTTILNTISGLLTTKEAQIEGVIALGNGEKDLTMTTVFQEPRLLPWRRVLRNISYGLEASGLNKKEALVKASKIIKTVNLDNYENYLPAQLSIGMQQRVNFARALVCNPNIMLLDEPFSALDVDTKETIIKEFKNVIIKNSITGIFVTHNVEEAFSLANRIITLSGRPSSVKNTIERKNFNKIPEGVIDYLDPFRD